MEFGYFDDDKREYVITTPRTPYPWINYLGTGDFTGIVSNTGSGYSYMKDARLRRLTRFRYNDQPVDSLGRWFYMREGGMVWSPGWAPVRAELDGYSCRHGLGYTVITALKNQLASELTMLSPVGEACEVHRLRLVNRSAQRKSFSLWSYAEFCLWNAYDDMTNFQRNWSTGEVQIEESGRAIMHITEYRERRNHYAFYASSQLPDGFDTDRSAFCGQYGSLAAPEAVLQGCSWQSEAHGWAPVASQRHDIELAAGEEKVLVFVLGYVEQDEPNKWDERGRANPAPMMSMLTRYAASEQVDAALRELALFWDAMLGSFSVQSQEKRLDRSVNIWNQYQCFTTFRVSRSASSFESGIGRGMGFRDTNQDIGGMVHLMPQRARERILDVAATQLRDGGAFHQYQPLTKLGNHDIGSDFNDDPLWLIYSTVAYIKETGDWSILKESVPFDNNPALADSLLVHLRRGFFKAADKIGLHGLPLIGRADWNDCLNLNCFSMTPDESFQTATNASGDTAESVMIAGMIVLLGREFARLAALVGDTALEAQVGNAIQRIEGRLLEYAWDGEWWLRAFDASGQPVGTAKSAEGRIFIESQAFLAWAGVGKAEAYPIRALDSVAKYLDTERGVMLVQPAFTKYNKALGEITSYPPGYKENAGIFCHSNPWVIIAEVANGRPERAYSLFSRLCPTFLGEKTAQHRLEPYVYAQMVAGRDASSFGEAKNSWLTGAAAWSFVAVTQWILGIRPDFDGLRISPALPAELGDFRVQRRFRGDCFDIRYEVGLGAEDRLVIELDGVELPDNLIVPPGDGLTHLVRVYRQSGQR
ncbi:MAG: glycosyl transferase [Spirochaetes bacterium GWD1_61_31]|nr:MAG: glycosyl transferase [Spirochaetes bacterium GWB1_60_80]OHD32957.1 MAG: glycosyl transferase [Spirochaetes bacterium GWC1_61_12]OHD38680.1 MAG: glycosyl transferase [Spirochaetes bacterium GWD1_61_31]OHD43211.1 MAG: glycosyl transferase [Spirochaetes bacterium GWE1_60_18]OHD58822.1 MAG: glycosyl transferase [Spirochaetes bacterium GWF1_60_12]HAP42688.1 glycosyl transferase [Spirochaetaceae bacterium]